MGWADWMIVNLSLEQQLSLEKEARIPYHTEDIGKIRQLCGQLIRQNRHQQILLNQAVGRITELEAMIACDTPSF